MSETTAEVLSFIDNLPASSDFPSLPSDINDHLPTDAHLPPTGDGPTASFRSPLPIHRPLPSPEGGRPSSSAKGASSPLSSSPKGGKPPSSTEGELRRSSRLSKTVDRLNLPNSASNVNIDPKMFEMFDNTPCPKGSKQITFRKNDQLSLVTRESINQQFLSTLRWDKFTHTCTNSHSALGSFISEHRRYLSKSNLLDYIQFRARKIEKGLSSSLCDK
jgi:hypothetical protein